MYDAAGVGHATGPTELLLSVRLWPSTWTQGALNSDRNQPLIRNVTEKPLHKQYINAFVRRHDTELAEYLTHVQEQQTLEYLELMNTINKQIPEYTVGLLDADNKQTQAPIPTAQAPDYATELLDRVFNKPTQELPFTKAEEPFADPLAMHPAFAELHLDPLVGY